MIDMLLFPYNRCLVSLIFKFACVHIFTGTLVDVDEYDEFGNDKELENIPLHSLKVRILRNEGFCLGFGVWVVFALLIVYSCIYFH
jgi:hypothetical protein